MTDPKFGGGALSVEDAGSQSLNKLRCTREEAAYMLSMSLRSLDYRISNQEIEVKRDGRRIYITIATLRQYAQRDHSVGRTQ